MSNAALAASLIEYSEKMTGQKFDGSTLAAALMEFAGQSPGELTEEKIDGDEEAALMRNLWDLGLQVHDLRKALNPLLSLEEKEFIFDWLCAIKVEYLRNLSELRGMRFRLGLEEEPDPVFPWFLIRFRMPEEYEDLEELLEPAPKTGGGQAPWKGVKLPEGPGPLV